jgi:hypothetical protein
VQAGPAAGCSLQVVSQLRRGRAMLIESNAFKLSDKDAARLLACVDDGGGPDSCWPWKRWH